MSRLGLVLTATVVTTFGCGVGVGYVVARRMLETKYAEALAAEIEETKEFYSIIRKGPGYETPEQAARTLGVKNVEGQQVNVVEAANALVGYAGRSFKTDDPKPLADSVSQAEVVNIFSRQPNPLVDDVDDEDVVPEAELRTRTEDAPYVITNLEFELNEEEYQQQTITWYEGDNVLADEDDQPVPNPDELVGLVNMQRFGHRSKDPNVVYIRNHILQIDYQVLRSEGKYSVEVAGLSEK